MVKTVFLDMDGVLCDMVTASLKANNMKEGHDDITQWNIAAIAGISRTQFWKNIDKVGVDFWANLEPYSWFKRIRDEIRKLPPEIKTYICTSPTRSHHSYAGKRLWLNKYMPYTPSFFGKNKFMLAGEGRLLIDDSDENCEKWVEYGGEAFLFPQPWNKARCLLDRREELVLSRIRSFITL